MMSLDNIPVEVGSLVDTQHAIDSTDNTSDHASYNRAYRPRSTFTFARPAFDTAGDTLSIACNRDNDRGGKQRSDHNFAFHLGLLFWITLWSRLRQPADGKTRTHYHF
jgi:hypothetical protein